MQREASDDDDDANDRDTRTVAGSPPQGGGGADAARRSALELEDDAVYHTSSAYARGLGSLWGGYQWLDRAPEGHNETDFWWHRHDEYGRD